MKRFIVLSITLFLALPVLAQHAEMADTMRSNGKIYVVITVLGIVLSVLLLYLFSIDSKVKKLEEKMKGKSN